jgi:hypothetical protein
MRRPGNLAGTDYWFGGVNSLGRLNLPVRRSTGFVHPATRVGFNPQPEPPGRWGRGRHSSGFVHPLNRVGFNPQPEPPGRFRRSAGFVHPGAMVGFNPQPEPPGQF